MKSNKAIVKVMPKGKQQEIAVSRRYLGVDGAPARYLLFAIPPRQP